MSGFTLVNVDVDTAQKLAEFVGALLAGGEGAPATPASSSFLAECTKLIEGGAAADSAAGRLASSTALVTKFLDQYEVVMAIESDGDIEGYFQAIASLTLSQSADGGGLQENLPVVQKAVEALISRTDSKAKLRLRVLVTLFNMSFSGQAKHYVISSIMRYALTTGQTALVLPYHARMVAWAADWALPAVDKRGLFLLTSDVLTTANETSLALGFFVLYLSTFARDAALPADAHTLAISAVISAIKSPVPAFNDRSTLLECFSPQQTTGPLASLVALLRVVCAGTLSDYRAFEGGHAALMAEHGISAADMMHEMRLLTLCSLGVQAQVLSYAAVAAALACSEDEVEQWVVQGIAAGLLEASMDQFSGVVTVTRCAHRSFGPENWAGTRGKLVELQRRVQGILSSISTHAQEPMQ